MWSLWPYANRRTYFVAGLGSRYHSTQLRLKGGADVRWPELKIFFMNLSMPAGAATGFKVQKSVASSLLGFTRELDDIKIAHITIGNFHDTGTVPLIGKIPCGMRERA
jgi:hypothetical protein